MRLNINTDKYDVEIPERIATIEFYLYEKVLVNLSDIIYNHYNSIYNNASIYIDVFNVSNLPRNLYYNLNNKIIWLSGYPDLAGNSILYILLSENGILKEKQILIKVINPKQKNLTFLTKNLIINILGLQKLKIFQL